MKTNLAKIISVSATSISLGLIILLFSEGYLSSTLIPGPISAHHSSFSDDCLKCHDSELKNLKYISLSKSQEKCISCHALGNNHDKAHNLYDGEKLKCVECHTEHKGSVAINFDNNKCQSCHQYNFNRFEKGHPKFANYPYRRRTRIIFDHQTHSRKYFQSKNIECNSCHKVDSKGEHMLTLDFKTNCSSCHLKQIYGEGQAQTGFAFIAMPKVDASSLGISWTSEADGELTEFIKLILSTDPETAKSLMQIQNLDLGDLKTASEEDRAAVKKILIALKNLYLELYSEGHSAIIKRLTKVTDTETDDLISGFPLSMFRKALKDWLPGSVKTVVDDSSIDEITPDELMQGGGWYRSGYSIYYRPKGHADSFIKAWMDLPENTGLKQNIFDSNAPGRCGYCHSIDFKTKVNWHSYQPDYKKGLTRFKHQSHFLVMKNQGCVTCHSIDPEAKNSYQQPNPDKFYSNFLALDKKICSDCHHRGKARNNCLECHNYHLEK